MSRSRDVDRADSSGERQRVAIARALLPVQVQALDPLRALRYRHGVTLRSSVTVCQWWERLPIG